MGFKDPRMDSIINDVMKASGARGLVIGIVDCDGNARLSFHGYANEEAEEAITEESIFGLGSITKSFTATAILQLASKGAIHLDDPVSKLIPEYQDPKEGHVVTVDHLLCHSAGFYPQKRLTVPWLCERLGMDDRDSPLEYDEDYANEAIKVIAGRLSQQEHLTGAPGTHFSYSNDSFGLLGDIVRRYGGEDSYETYIQKNILWPLGMKHSGTGFSSISATGHAAKLYRKSKGTWKADYDFTDNAFVLPGGGAMKTSVHDMVLYIKALMGHFKDILGPGGFEELVKPRAYVQPGLYYAAGLERRESCSRDIIEHAGSMTGVSSDMIAALDGGPGVFVLSNTSDVPVAYIAEAAFKLALGLDPLPIWEDDTGSKWDGEALKNIQGAYLSDEGGLIEIADGGNGPVVRRDGEALPLYCAGEDTGYVQHPCSRTWLTVIKDKNGDVYALRYGSRMFPKILH